MHPEIGATELLVIAAVALIVVGPKDLPILLRKLGQFMAKLRNMANDFRASFDEMARQSELDELRREVEAMRKGQLADMAALNAGQAEVHDTFSEIDHSLTGVQFPPRPAPAEPIVEAAPQPAMTVTETPKAARKPRAKPAATKPAASDAPAPKRKTSVKAGAAPAAAKPKAAPRARKPKTEAGA